MFPTFYVPGVDTSENHFGFEFYALTFKNTAGDNILYGVKANKPFTTYPDTNPLSTGATITEIALPSLNLTGCSLAWDTVNTFVAGGFDTAIGGIVYRRSTDKGVTWTTSGLSSASAGGVYLLAYQAASDTFYTVLSDVNSPFFSIHRSTDAGANWTDITTAVTSTGLTGGFLNWWSWVDGANFYIGFDSSSVVACSSDGGATWSAANLPSGSWRLFKLNNLFVISDPNSANLRYASALSSNLGDWTDRTSGLGINTVRSLTYISSANQSNYGLWLAHVGAGSTFFELTNTDFLAGVPWTSSNRAEANYIGGVAGATNDVKNMAIFMDVNSPRLTFNAYQVGDNLSGNPEAYTYISVLAQATTVDSPVGLFLPYESTGIYKGRY